MRAVLVIAACSALGGCSLDASTTASSHKADRGAGAGYAPISFVDLDVNIGARTARATLTFDAPTDNPVLDVGDLDIESLSTENGGETWEVVDGELRIDATALTAITARYAFRTHNASDSNGWLRTHSTVTWPSSCGNLFPCNPSPAEGALFNLQLHGIPEGERALYAHSLPTEAPLTMIAWAVGDYTCRTLGTTGAGTRVRSCWLPREEAKAERGTERLRDLFDWYERTLGPYAFGDEVASVSAHWGDAAAGGIEHHPYWHIADVELDIPLTHAHEAAHGWFGSGVRIACWEDFVLSEGTVSYLSARAIGQVLGPAAEEAIWRDDYGADLEIVLEDEDIIVWPRETCGEVDLIEDGLFSNAVYYKGAFFFREIAEQIGADRLDRILSKFYKARVGTAARFEELIALIEHDAEIDLDNVVERWLRTRGNPLAHPRR